MKEYAALWLIQAYSKVPCQGPGLWVGCHKDTVKKDDSQVCEKLNSKEVSIGLEDHQIANHMTFELTL